MNWSLSAANFCESAAADAFDAGLAFPEPDGSNTMSESTAKQTETLGAGICNPPGNSANRASAAPQRGQNTGGR